MRSHLVLRSPNQGTGWSDSWAFSGRDESTLRDHLQRLDAYLTQAPIERWEPKKHTRIIDAEDRWLAARLLYPEDQYSRSGYPEPAIIQAEAAWTATGARHLAEVLPDELEDLRTGISERFGPLDADRMD